MERVKICRRRRQRRARRPRAVRRCPDEVLPEPAGRGRGPPVRSETSRELHRARVRISAAAPAVRRRDGRGPRSGHSTQAQRLTLQSHSGVAYDALGRVIASAGGRPQVRQEYERGFMQALAVPSNPSRHTAVLRHIAGHLQKRIDAAAARRNSRHVHRASTARGLVPLVVPLTLVRHHVRAARRRLPRRPDLPGAASARADAAQPCLKDSAACR